MSVKRYECGMTNAPTEYQSPTMHKDANGGYVSYEDYAALEAKCAALAAENAGLKAACGGDGSYRDCPACAHSEYIEAPETQDTDAFLAEVRAQGVDMLAEKLRENIAVDSSGSTRARALTRIVDRASAQLRQEAAQ